MLNYLYNLKRIIKTKFKSRFFCTSLKVQENESLRLLLIRLGLPDKLVENALIKKKFTERVKTVLSQSEVQNASIDKEIGLMLYLIAEKLPSAFNFRLPLLLKYTLNKKLANSHQLDLAIIYLKEQGKSNFSEGDFENYTGIGVEYTNEEYYEAINEVFMLNKAKIIKEKENFNLNSLVAQVRKKLKFSDGKKVKQILDNMYYGLISETDKITNIDDNLSNDIDTKIINESENLYKLVARDLRASLNSSHLLEKHLEFTKGNVLTRFPPEPNGYLHIGHAKAMRFNFMFAEKKNGMCYLRYDDTDPDKESKEFVNMIKENVEWLGYKPWKITYASDYFQEMYFLARSLIIKGKAYVCHQSKEEINNSRKLMLESPYRERTVQENLDLFEKMKLGEFQEKECCLRMKIDMKHQNPCMRDPVAYRIKYTPHPNTGKTWFIYPTYDFTHCINDSLENITHSLCTLEFEIRRDSYYWLLEALDIYRPFVWEYSRLNITRNIVSKRKLSILVNNKLVLGWDDPRLLTLNGLKRRGYTPEAINDFVELIGVTRRGNENIVSINLLENSLRKILDKSAPRTLSVLDPIKVTLENVDIDQVKEIEVLLFPKDNSKGKKIINLTKYIFIDRNDFREIYDDNHFGLGLNKETGLKYAGTIVCKRIIKKNNVIVELICEYFEETKKTKGRIHWISERDAIKSEVRMYDYLFLSDNPNESENFLNDVNRNSLSVHDNALINNNILEGLNLGDHFQFERLGYFVLDQDSDIIKGRYVFNQCVDLVNKNKI